MQTKDSWCNFINKSDSEIVFVGNASELYFEEGDLDVFIQNINSFKDINYVHTIIEHTWGQRIVRFYDPDKHIIEVGKIMTMVVKRLLKNGLLIEDTAIKMDVPVDYVKSCLV